MGELEVLLTGGAGQVGRELQRFAPAHWRIAAPSPAELDIADAEAVSKTVAARPWSLVVNAAAFTGVEAAERDADGAWLANATGARLLAEAAAERGLPLIHLSTDYVFDGRKGSPHVEDDPTRPLNVYGASKAAGEAAVRAAGARHLIVRTAWLVSPHGANFARTMLRLAAEGGPIRVVDDQRGCPTSAADLAEVLIALAERQIAAPDAVSGTYHAVNAGEATWCDLARAILDRAFGAAAPPVEAVATGDYPTIARRPADSRLSTAKLECDFGLTLRAWRAAVDEVVDALVAAPARVRP